ncbi:MAG TPA: zf-HC2 domain-containing protein [Candidatus Binataceae bacterium]|nr:zf-HC2 domain-containing protein [Candidatus Binataceae bacterium]
MAQCSEISLLLGPFGDGELESGEIREVAFHLARCESCAAELADLTSLGNELRLNAIEPALDGFQRAVMKRIDELPEPFTTRVSDWFAGLSRRLSTGFAMGAAMAAVAAITTIVVTPYAERFSVKHLAQPMRELASVTHLPPVSGPREVASAIPASALKVASNSGTAPDVREISGVTHLTPDQEPVAQASAISDEAMAMAQNSEAVISKLESESPNVAVWSEPQNDTTVIWLPDQQQ